MTTTTRDKTRLVDDKLYFRCYAYQHKTEPERFGLLEAVSYKDAKRHLGGGFRIKADWAPHDVVVLGAAEDKRAAIGIIFQGRIPRADPTIGHAADGLPIFAARATGGPFRYSAGRDGTRPNDGCHLVFICPKCGKENCHGGDYGKKGGGDGHRVSHCDCWPHGYYIREV